MKLRDRCKKLYERLGCDAILRQGDPVQTIMDFVLAENGRAVAGDALPEAKAVVLYFTTSEDREEFISTIHKVKPELTVRKATP